MSASDNSRPWPKVTTLNLCRALDLCSFLLVVLGLTVLVTVYLSHSLWGVMAVGAVAGLVRIMQLGDRIEAELEQRQTEGRADA